MNNLILAACIALLPAIAAADCGGHGKRSAMLVTPAWLSAHLKDSNLAVLGVGDSKQYAAAHIPGSAMVEMQEIATRGDLTLELPPMPDLAATFAKKGVSDDSRIVLYMTKDQATQTARVYMTLDAMGFGARTSILDGGLPAWRTEGHPVTAEVPAVKPGAVTPCSQSDVITSFDYVRTHLNQAG